jgi:hypothetical protein
LNETGSIEEVPPDGEIMPFEYVDVFREDGWEEFDFQIGHGQFHE